MQKIYRKEANIYAELLIYDIMQFLFAIVLAAQEISKRKCYLYIMLLALYHNFENSKYSLIILRYVICSRGKNVIKKQVGE